MKKYILVALLILFTITVMTYRNRSLQNDNNLSVPSDSQRSKTGSVAKLTSLPDKKVDEQIQNDVAKNNPDTSQQTINKQIDTSTASLENQSKNLEELTATQLVHLLLSTIRSDGEYPVKKIYNKLMKLSAQEDADNVIASIAAIFSECDERQQRILVKLLGNIPTKESLTLLLQLANNKAENNISDSRYNDILNKIEEMGDFDTFQGEDIAADLFSVYSEAILSNPKDMDIIYATSKGMANLGTVEAISSLLDVLDMETGDSEKTAVITESFKEISNEATTDVLADELINGSVDILSSASIASGWGLSALNDPGASEIIIKFAAQNKEPENIPYIVNWVDNIYDEKTMYYILDIERFYTFEDENLLREIQQIAIEKTQPELADPENITRPAE